MRLTSQGQLPSTHLLGQRTSDGSCVPVLIAVAQCCEPTRPKLMSRQWPALAYGKPQATSGISSDLEK